VCVVPNQIASLLKRMHSVTVTVFGDFCLDAYWGLCEGTPELSIETGLPVRRVKTQRYSLGGAGNVVANLTALEVGCVRPIGVAGADMFGDKLRSLLAANGAELSGFVADGEWETMVYAKPCFGPREDSRVDFGAFNTVHPGMLDKLTHELEAAAVNSDAVVLNQQIPAGLSSPAMIERINDAIAAHPGVIFLVDSRHYPEKYKDAALKLNMSDAARLLEEDAEPSATDARAKRLAMLVGEKTGKPAFLTRGEFGMVVAADGEATLIPGLQVTGPTDPVGAGDAVVAALAAALATGASPVSAAVLANIAAMITVRKLQTTGTASAAEILAAEAVLSYGSQAELEALPARERVSKVISHEERRDV
jgi:rfaE bifunctional protein kinase chain/domain